MDANTKFDIFCDQISQFTSYHVPRRKLSKREIKLSAKPWITKHILAKYDIEINSIPKSLGINIQIQFWYIFTRIYNSVVKDLKASKSDYFKNYFLCNKNNMKKSDLE